MTPNAEIAGVVVKRHDARFEAGLPVVLFRIPGLVAANPTFRTDYAVARDGRFLMTVCPLENNARINVALNWRR